MSDLSLCDKNFKKIQCGITLVELMVVLSVLAIVSVIAVPSFSALLANNRITSMSNELLAHLQYARVEATRAARKVSICSSVDGMVCANSTSWSKGWLIWTDFDKDGALDSSEIIRVQGPIASNLTLTGPKVLTFGPIGSAVSETFSFIHGNPSVSRWVCVQATGAANVQSKAC
jgi:type IV fimbrial biogenesis protein FimT